MNYPIYCKDYDEEGESWTYRVILNDHHGFQYSYLIKIVETNGAVYELMTNEVNDPVLIDKWLFELQAQIFLPCSQDTALRQIRQAQGNIDELINKAVLINTKDNG